MTGGLVRKLHDYSAWRQSLASRVHDYRRWLERHSLAESHVSQELDHVLARLAEEKLTIAFVAEFSRGKSELINAIFFPDYGQRLLASSTGRTTMCPTELQWDAAHPPQLMLLPIETRAGNATTSELKRFPEEWHTVSLDIGSADTLSQAFKRVCETKFVPLDEAKNYALFVDAGNEANTVLRPDGTVEIPRWRHAIINFPHPFLEQGLVILDTPGLNAIGTEPELTLNLLPNAQAVLFILALDTGVTKSDLAVWRDYIAPSQADGRFRYAVLNKIDTLWDDLRSDAEIQGEIDRQVRYCSETLGIDADKVFPVSAQRGLLAKIQKNETLLARSRLRDLEQTLSQHLIPHRQAIICEATRQDVARLMAGTRDIVAARAQDVRKQIDEVMSLKGRNLNIVNEMVRRVRAEKTTFDQGLVGFQRIRNEFAELSNGALAEIGIDALNESAKQTLIQVKSSRFTPGVRSALQGYFKTTRDRMSAASDKVRELHTFTTALYERLEAEHGFKLVPPPSISLERYSREIDRLEGIYHRHFDTLFAVLTTEALTLLQKFFETMASQVRKVFGFANRELETWLRMLIAPVETRIKEHQQMLRRRLDTVKRIYDSTESLEDRLHELERGEAHLNVQLGEIDALAGEVSRALAVDSAGDLAAAA
jgi:hypothetical protein